MRLAFLALLLVAPLPVQGQAARYVEVRPVRSVQLAGSAGDIQSQLPAGHPYLDPDPVTSAHETIHGINARIRNSNGAQNGYYLLGSRGFVCPHPRFTLRQLAKRIPAGRRGQVYNLYLVNATQWWNDTPFYVMDECAAYVHGSRVGLELNQRARSLDSFNRALEMWLYVRESQRMARESGYAHQAAFDEFMDSFHREHIAFLLTEYRRRGWR